MIVLYSIFTLVCALLCLLYYYTTKNYNYWKKRNVPYLKPTPLFGNYREYILFRKYGPQVAREICQQFPNEPYVGVYYGTDPALIVKDPNIIKLVMTKDFYYFNQREVANYTHKELITQNMFFIGGDRWKVLRQNLTPIFSSSKIKNMFYLIENCAKNLEDLLSYEVKLNKTLEIKSIITRFTMDCIGSCTFGVNTCTLEKNSKNNPFTILGTKLFDVTNYGGFRLISRAMWPAIFYKLGFKLFESSVEDFFIQLLTDVFKSRNYKPSSRHDFVDLLLNWKQQDCIVGNKISNMITDEKETVEIKVDDNLLVSLCALLFAAGYDTTATTTSHLLFELAKHKEIQSKVIKEVDDYYQKHDGKLNFECITETPFLQACIDETLRLYPVLGTLTREVDEVYTLPTGLRLNKGMRVHIPVYYLHHNEEHFPEPEKFRPERFFGDEKKNIKQFTYMPFGEGPRICIGLRFSKMPLTAAILTVFKKYRIELADIMSTSLKFEPRCLVNEPVGGVYLKFIPRDT